MIHRPRPLEADERGANLVEYIVLVGIVALIASTGYRAFGRQLDTKIRCLASRVSTGEMACTDRRSVAGGAGDLEVESGTTSAGTTSARASQKTTEPAPPANHAPPDPGDRPGGTGPCDKHMAALFGGPGAIAAGSGYEPAGLQGNLSSVSGLERWQGGDTANQWGHLWGYSMHLYGASVGQTTTEIYVPQGFTKHQAPHGDDATTLFYYPTLGNEHNVTLVIYHVKNFAIRPDERNDAGSIRIGTNGGPSGDDANYVHSHFEMHRGWGLPSFSQRNKTRVFFHDAFCQ